MKENKNEQMVERKTIQIHKIMKKKVHAFTAQTQLLKANKHPGVCMWEPQLFYRETM